MTDPASIARHKTADWVFWLLGAAMLAAVVTAALHFSEAREFVRLAEQAELRWLLLAVLLQVATYAAEAEIWRGIGRHAGVRLQAYLALRLSLAKLFVDQALPSAGLSGTLVVARALADHGMGRGAITAGVVVRTVSYYAAYVCALGSALAIAIVHGQANRLVEFAALGFLVFAVLFSAAALALAGRDPAGFSERLSRFTHVRSGLELLAEADPVMARNVALLMQASVLQLAIVLLDASTMWVLLQALGAGAPAASVFASFMLSTLFRSLGILPGGLGSFEAVSVLTLKLVGVPLPVALAATLVFRGLSFWLPMLPGFWCSRRLLGRRS